MFSSNSLPLIAACVAALASPIFSAPTITLNARQAAATNTIPPGTGPAGIVCYSEPDSSQHGALPVGSGLTWYVTVPASSLPPGLPLAKHNEGTGSALSAALKHKCGLGITYEKYQDVSGGLYATFTTPMTCRKGSVHDAIDNAFHTAGGKSPDALCTETNGDSPGGGEIGASVWDGLLEGLGAAAGDGG